MKTLLISLILFTCCLFCQAQVVYYYKYVSTIDQETGLKSKDKNTGSYRNRYYCFFDDFKHFAECDKNGNIHKNPYANRVLDYCQNYIGTKNGLLVYKDKDPALQAIFTYCFSNDYSRLNIHYDHSKYNLGYEIGVFERATPGDVDIDAPDTLY